MGINVSQCCCCGIFSPLKMETLLEAEQNEVRFSFDFERIVAGLEKAQGAFLQWLLEDIENFYSDSACFLGYKSSEKGHVLKISFTAPCSPNEFTHFIDSHPRQTWDKLVDKCEKLEENNTFDVQYIKYKSQLSYSSKELVIAQRRGTHKSGILAVFSSVDCQKACEGSGLVEVIEGGYFIEGTEESAVNFLLHFQLKGGNSSKFLLKLCEKLIPETIKRLTESITKDRIKPADF